MQRPGPRARSALARAVPILVLIVVPLAAHWPELLGLVDSSPAMQMAGLALHAHAALLPGSPYIDGAAGTDTMSLGRLSAESWLALRLPWWNPYSGVGLPLASQMQPSAFFLPFVLLLHFTGGMLMLKLAMQVLAGLFCFAFLRRLGLASWACLLAAALFGCNGSFALYADAPILPIPFLPLLFLGLEEARQRAVCQQPGGAATIGLAIAYSLVAGFPETAFLDGLLALAWTILRACALGPADARRFCFKVVHGGIVGLLLASPVLVPFLQDLAHSTFGFDRAASAGHGLPVASLPLLLFPFVYGAPMTAGNFLLVAWIGGFFGTVAMLLGLAARPGSAPRGAVTLLLVWLAIGLLIATGVPVVDRLVRALPGFNLIVVSRYGFPSFSFCLSVLGAFALDRYAKNGACLRMARPAIVLGVAMLAALIIGFGTGLSAGEPPASKWLRYLLLAWGLGAPLGLLLLLGRPSSVARRCAVSMIVIADAIGLFTPPLLTAARAPRAIQAPISFLAQHAGLGRVISVGDVFWPNSGAYFGFPVLNYFYVPVPAAWGAYVADRLVPGSMQTTLPNLFEAAPKTARIVVDHRQALEALGVRFVVAPSWLPLFGPAGKAPLSRVFHQDGVDIFELPNARPYLDILGGPCRLVQADRLHQHAMCGAPAQLLRRELYFPGWHARVNGRRAGIARSDEIFQRIDLPAGSSVVSWRYVPENANAIAIAFVSGLLGLLLAARGWRTARWRLAAGWHRPRQSR